MAYVFDSLGYAKRLRDGGVPRDQAEVHAEAARDFIMVELATKADLLPMAVKSDVAAVKADVLAVKADLLAAKQELQGNIAELSNRVDTLGLRLTVRLGAMIVVAIGALAAILKLA